MTGKATAKSLPKATLITQFFLARSANHTVDRGREAGLQIVGNVSGGPGSGRELGDAPDGGVSEAGQDFG